MTTTILVGILVALAFLIGFEMGRLYRRVQAYLISIRRALHESSKPKVHEEAGVVLPSRRAASEPTILTEDSGGVLPMSPRAVAMEEARREREGR